jgi:hypothetical protein
MDNSAAEALAEVVGDELLKDGPYDKNPERFAKEFIEKEEWSPPLPTFVAVDGFQKNVATNLIYLSDRTTQVFAHSNYPVPGVYYDLQQKLYKDGKEYTPPLPTFVAVDGFQKNVATNLIYLPDKTTQVFLHDSYPGQGIYYDQQQRLYQNGALYTPPTFVAVDGFQKNVATGSMFLPDKVTEVFEHTSYPGQGIYYDRQNQFYQRGERYEAAAAAEEPINLATDKEIIALLDSASNYEELTKAVAAGELAIAYDDEDISSFDGDQFVNVD